MMNVDGAKLDEYFWEDSVILEVDRDYLRTQMEPVIPTEKRDMIIEGIERLVTGKEDRYREFTQKYTHLYSIKYEELFWKTAEIRVKRLFLNFFITTINNYLGFYKTEEEIKGKVLKAENIFDFEKYISKYPKNEQSFMKLLTSTQSFNLFIEKSFKSN